MKRNAMAIRVGLHHVTEYRYDREIALGPHVIRLRPCVHSRTPVLAYSMKVEPAEQFLNWQQDPFGNWVARLVFPEKARKLRIEVDLVADMTVINPFDFFLEKSAEEFPFEYDDHLAHELAPYLKIREEGEKLSELLAAVPRERKRTVDFLVELNMQVHHAVGYVIRMEPGVQSCEETLTLKTGSCRDSAYLLVQVLRHLGLAARFVSGYLVQLRPDQESLDGPSGPAEDFTDLHAWAEVFVPGAGWVGLDPTSGLFAGEGHIPLSCTPEPASAAPVVGTLDACRTEFFHVNEVTRVHEDPRVTMPYTDEEWATIEALGRRVDDRLDAADVAMTMGGEPTFVSIDNMDGEEWNISADSKEKRRLALTLLERLEKVFAPGGLLHYGEGKWYPGEPLPRWAYTVLWRKDGQPLWADRSLLASPTAELGHGPEEARRFAEAFAEALHCRTAHVVAGFEDAFYYAWREGTLPVDVDPHRADLDDPLERKYLVALLDRGMKEATGYVLPIEWDIDSNRWQSARWSFRREQMFLLPGGSPMGFRLPLQSLVGNEGRIKERADLERSPLEPVEPLAPPGGFLPSGRTLQTAHGEARPPGAFADLPPEPGREHQESGDEDHGEGMPHTAMCFEPRNGRLHVFFPPVSQLEHYLVLLEAVEATARRLGLPVVLKAAADGLRHRLDLGAVRLDLATVDAVQRAYRDVATQFGAQVLIQRMVPPGVACVVESTTDPTFGPVVGFGLGGVATDLLGDRAWRAAPLTDRDAAGLVDEPRAAPLLSGYRGAGPVDRAALVDLLLRVGRLADEQPQVHRLRLNPVLARPGGLTVLHASVVIGSPDARPDTGPRRL